MREAFCAAALLHPASSNTRSRGDPGLLGLMGAPLAVAQNERKCPVARSSSFWPLVAALV